MALGADKPLSIWAVSDGRSGIEAQVVGLAQAVAKIVPAQLETKRIAWKGPAGRLPWQLNLFPRQALSPDSGIVAPWPDLWIAAGRASLPLSMRMRRWSKARTYVVQVQDPRAPHEFFDLIAPPRHDRAQGPNVFDIIGSPHRATPERLAADYAKFESRLGALPHPRVAVLIGGRSRAFDLTPERAAAMAREIEQGLDEAGGSLMLSFSRRTPPDAKAILSDRLSHLPGMIYDGEGENPYFAFLAAADFVLVTEDSTNMAVEAASTGAPVFILKMDGESPKFRRLHEQLERHGAARPFGGSFHGWTYEPLRETERLAAEVVRRMAARV